MVHGRRVHRGGSGGFAGEQLSLDGFALEEFTLDEFAPEDPMASRPRLFAISELDLV